MEVKKTVRKAADATDWNPMRLLGSWGVRSSHAYTLGVIAGGAALIVRLASRIGDDDGRSGRVPTGACAAALLTLGVGLKLEEES